MSHCLGSQLQIQKIGRGGGGTRNIKYSAKYAGPVFFLGSIFYRLGGLAWIRYSGRIDVGATLSIYYIGMTIFR